jgi:predicted nucleic acid-binding protein
MTLSTRTSPRVADRSPRGLLDTSVVIDLDSIEVELLPEQVTVSAVTLAELAAGPAATADLAERARRQDRLQRVEAAFDPLPFDVEAARAYGRIYAAVRAHGRTPRRRLADLLIASVALANDLPVVTRNGADFAGLDELVNVIEI